MKRSELVGLIMTALMVAAVIFIGSHYRAQIEAATNPLMDMIRAASSAGAAVGMVAGVGMAAALIGYVLCRVGRLVYKRFGETPADILGSVISAGIVVLVFCSAIPGGLAAIWVVALFSGAGLAAWRG